MKPLLIIGQFLAASTSGMFASKGDDWLAAFALGLFCLLEAVRHVAENLEK